MYMPACTSVHHGVLGALEGQKNGLDPLELEF